MKKFLMSMGAAILFAFSINTHATMMYTVDELLFSTDLGNSGDSTEIQELADFLMVSLDDVSLVEKNNAPMAMMVTDMGVEKWVIDVGLEEPGYYALKFGTGGTGENNTYYFRNLVNLNELVFTDQLVNGLMSSCISYDCRLSHYTSLNAVPLPAAFWLFGSALLGLLALARRRNQHASYA